MAMLTVFQLTTSRGGRQTRSCQNTLKKYFNSRPHEEVDIVGLLIPADNKISTHDLTRRSTFMSRRTYEVLVISTHDLTRRSTDSELFCIIATLFQLTTSRGGRQVFLRG